MLDKLEKKIGRFAIRNLMVYIIIGMAVVFVCDIVLPYDLAGKLAFSVPDIMAGQVWRLITFIFLPPSTSYLFIFFSLYFYWLLGSALENQWGAFRFNIFYLVGMLGTMVSGLITGYATNYYINMSLFFAFAILYPNFQLNLFFFLPIKIKWLALIDAALFLLMLITNTWQGRVAIAVSLLNLALFFGKDVINGIKQMRRRAKWKRDTKPRNR